MVSAGIVSAGVVAVVLLFALYKRSRPQSVDALPGQDGGEGWEKAGRGEVQNFLPDYPDDHQIYFPNFDVAGLAFRKDEALRFSRSSNLRLEIAAEPTNQHDRNAIAVYGTSDEGRLQIGYVPAEISKRIAGAGGPSELKPRLRRIFISNDPSPPAGNYVEIRMQLTGPRAGKNEFLSIASNHKLAVRKSAAER